MAQPEVRRDFEVDFDSDVPEISERLKEVFDDGNVAKFSFTALLDSPDVEESAADVAVNMDAVDHDDDSGLIFNLQFSQSKQNTNAA
ncbi:hypothetical protein AcW1_001730 [Taiwanofungus camphoratus]|nr:hypothetical protein AcW1_001730 [Antrodia cinnamomea]